MEVTLRRKNEADAYFGAIRSPKGIYESYNRSMSQEFTASVPGVADPSTQQEAPALARPFEVDMVRLAPGMKNCPLHIHRLRWEDYIMVSGRGRMLQESGVAPLPMEPGDHLLQPPGQAHTVENDGREDLLYYVIADNPSNETCFYPDSGKWWACGHVFRMVDTRYFDGEE